MIDVEIGGIRTELDEGEVKKVFRAARVFTTQDHSIFCITPYGEEHPELIAIGGHPTLPYSYHGAFHPDHPASAGFRCEIEWRGFPRELYEIAFRVATEQAEDRKALRERRSVAA